MRFLICISLAGRSVRSFMAIFGSYQISEIFIERRLSVRSFLSLGKSKVSLLSWTLDQTPLGSPGVQSSPETLRQRGRPAVNIIIQDNITESNL